MFAEMGPNQHIISVVAVVPVAFESHHSASAGMQQKRRRPLTPSYASDARMGLL